VPFFCTGWAPCDGVVPHCAKLGTDVVEDPEFGPTLVPPHYRFSVRLWWQELGWDRLLGNQAGKLVTGHLGKRIQVTHLLLNVFIGTVKPEAFTCSPVNAQRPTDSISVPAGLQDIVLGEDLNAFPPASLDRNTQPQGNAANVDPAISGWERLRHEDPDMSPATAILKCRLHPVLPEVKLELEEISERILIVRVNGQPLRALGDRVDSVQTDGDFAFKVATDCVWRQVQPLARGLVLGSIVIMPGTFWAGSVGLEGVGPAVDKETKVIRHHTGWGFETKHPHSLLPESTWVSPPHLTFNT